MTLVLVIGALALVALEIIRREEADTFRLDALTVAAWLLASACYSFASVRLFGSVSLALLIPGSLAFTAALLYAAQAIRRRV